MMLDVKFIRVAVLAIAWIISSGVHAEYGGQCVRYVKNQKPGGFLWDKYYSIKKNGKPLAKTCDKKAVANGYCVYWVPAKDIWTNLYTQSRGDSPKVGSVLVLDAFKNNSAGHVAIVTKVAGNKISVTHSNWESYEQVIDAAID